MTAHAHRRAASPVLVVLGLAMVLGACDGLFGPRGDVLRDELRRNERLWSNAGTPTAYTMTSLQLTVADPDADAVRLEIVGGAVVAGTTIEDERPLSAAELADFHTIAELFALIRDALDRRTPVVAVNYNPEYGYPREIFIDYNLNSSTDDIYVLITDLVFGSVRIFL